MRGLLIVVVIALVGYFGYELAANGRTPGQVLSGSPASGEDLLPGDDLADGEPDTSQDLGPAADDNASAAEDGDATADAPSADIPTETAGERTQAEVEAAVAEAESYVDDAASEMTGETTGSSAAADQGVTTEEAAAAAEAAANEAAEAAETAEAAADAAETPAPEGADAGTATGTGTQDTGTPATGTASAPSLGAQDIAGSAGLTVEELDALLTPEGYDPARVAEVIEASDLTLAQKTGLVGAVNTSAGDPEETAALIERLRETMGF